MKHAPSSLAYEQSPFVANLANEQTREFEYSEIRPPFKWVSKLVRLRMSLEQKPSLKVLR